MGLAFDGEKTKEGREFVNERLSAGVQMIISLWHTAWVWQNSRRSGE
jgi:hypothetical protein